jgi:AcrR family transcriptional regulator
MRRQLSDTATRMFLERGFDAVTVSEVAAACGVSEKTVFNYVPSKEALLLDRLEPAVDSIRAGLADPGSSPVATVVRILEREIHGITTILDTGDPGGGRPDPRVREPAAQHAATAGPA